MFSRLELSKPCWLKITLYFEYFASQVIKAKYSKYSVIFNQQGFDNSNLENKPEFLPL